MKRRIYLITGSCIVLVDLISKIVFYYLIPKNEPFYLFNSKSYFYTITNEELSYQVSSIMEKSNISVNQVFVILFTYLILGLYILAVRKLNLKKSIKVLLGLLIFILGAILSSAFTVFWGSIDIPNLVFEIVRFSGPILLGFAFFSISKDCYLKFIITAFISAGIGNALSLFYPPFVVIDFLFIDILNRIFNTGVMNIADIIINISMILMVAYILIYLPICKLKRNKSYPKKDYSFKQV